MANVNREIIAQKRDGRTFNTSTQQFVYEWGSWGEPGNGYTAVDGNGHNLYTKSYKIQGGIDGTVTALAFAVNAYHDSDENLSLTAYLFDSEPTGMSLITPDTSGNPIATASKNVPEGAATSISFSFSGLHVDATKTLYVVLSSSSNASIDCQSTATATATTSYSQLGINITPSTVGTGSSITISFANRAGQSVLLTFRKGSTTLYTTTATSDSIQVTPTNEWFTTAGETGTSMTVSVSASDSLGRTASGSFSLKQALTVTTSAPKNTTRTATDSMYYGWSVSGNTTQTSAELYINGTKRETITGSNPYVYSSYRPSSGTVSWYVKVTNNLGVTSQSDTATFTIQYISTSYLAPYNSKTSGSINRFAANTFDVQMKANGTPSTDYPVVNPVFYWRQSGESSWNSVPMTRVYVDGVYKRATVTIPANTFPKGTIQWYAEAGDGQGNTRTTSTYNLSTVAVPITATPISPIDTIEERNTPTDFVWRNSSTLPSTQASAELQYSQDQSTWTSLGTVTGTATTFTAAANSVPSGQISWRVRVKNIDNVYGSWSNPATFVNYGAPVVANVQADTKPYTTITWSASTQQSYLLIVDGKAYGPYIGENTRSFTMFEPLADGNHVVVAMAQNDQGLWNDPEETAFSVLNVPGESLILSSESFVDTALSWNRGNNTGDFYVYRDGEIIGHTHKNSFLDRMSVGTHDFFVIEKLDTGYYTKSNVITTTTDTNEINMISLLSGGEWVSMVHALKSQPDLTYKDTQAVAYNHMSGRRYPSASISEFRDRAVSGSVVFLFTEEDAHCRFKSLFGMPVILKTKDSDLITGILDSWERTVKNQYYTAYSFTVTVVDAEDFIDDT